MVRLGINVLSVVSGVGAATRILGAASKLTRFKKIYNVLDTVSDLKRSEEYVQIMSKLNSVGSVLDVFDAVGSYQKIFLTGYSSLLNKGVDSGSKVVSKVASFLGKEGIM